MKKLVLFLLLISVFFFVIGCNEKEEDTRIVIEISKEEYEIIEKEVAKELKSGENLKEKTTEKVIFEKLLEEELQDGYIYFAEELERMEAEVPPYFAVRDYLKDFFLSDPAGEEFLENFEEEKNKYRIVIIY